LDHQDQCPDIAGEAAYNGCLAPDSDNDGVTDATDKCPNEAGSIQNNGCPEISEETKELLDQALEGLQFESGKDIIKASSFVILDQVVNLMNEHPDSKLTISGYTDSSGNDESNLSLSENRAQKVKEYLVNKGIQGNRLSAKGYGESNPIADNGTPEGRRKNRRVALEIQY